MAEERSYNYGFGKIWSTVHVERRSGYHSSVTDYHKHDFYEINLILSGNVKILLKDTFEEGRENRIVLTRPDTPHFISCDPDTLYQRLYLVFTDAFIADCFPEWQKLSSVFGKNGTILTLCEEETARFQGMIEQIEREPNAFGQRLLIYYLLLQLLERTPERLKSSDTPSYILDALTYLETHYAERINFASLAESLYVGRTTLMTEFKRYTETTLGQYLTQCRLRHAIRHLRQGKTIEYAAEACGFSDSSGFIRAFKRHYGMTPYKYVKGNP